MENSLIGATEREQAQATAAHLAAIVTSSSDAKPSSVHSKQVER